MQGRSLKIHLHPGESSEEEETLAQRTNKAKVDWMRGSTRSSCPHPAAAEHTEFTGLFKKYFDILVFAFIGFFLLTGQSHSTKSLHDM